MSRSDSSQSPDPQPSQRVSRTNRTQNEFDMLQSLLVAPEVDRLRRQISELQQQVATLQDKVQQLEDEVQNSRSSTHQLIDEKLGELRQHLLTRLPDMIDEAIEEQIDPGQTFSFRLSGVEED